MFGPSREEIKAEVLKELIPLMRDEMESVKEEYASEIRRIQREAEDIRIEHTAVLKELKKVSQQNRELTQLLNEKQPGLTDVADLKTKVAEIEKRVGKITKMMESLGSTTFESMDGYIPPAESEAMELYYMR